ncbi:hypothetical protein POVWA2_023640 [Plasmodium ovale wallikeri]|uniref:Uncharacterized protein n=1 Tax=Plasmodium ovale wallikeri TaxID=864142 RepID=A0A1A8YU38_PLAOA|nr:hypothetical protein POVWA2_023640 [Plasmodium ovale wallikeri]SBT56721.1 hypothetical protein POVWA1_078070 [Plasmodium ovale wallikeri]
MRTRVGTHNRAGITNMLCNLWRKEPGKLRAGVMCKMGRRETVQGVMEQICINQEVRTNGGKKKKKKKEEKKWIVP